MLTSRSMIFRGALYNTSLYQKISWEFISQTFLTNGCGGPPVVGREGVKRLGPREPCIPTLSLASRRFLRNIATSLGE